MHSARSIGVKRSAGLAILWLLMALGTAVPCWSIDLNRQVEFAIPPQKLSAALIQFSHQARVQVVIRENLGDQVTSGVTGKHTIGEALQQLLGPSGLSFRAVGDTSITVEKPATGSDARGSADQQPVLSAEASASPVHPAQARTDLADSVALTEVVVTAQKRTEKVQDVPASISVLGGEQLANSSANSLTDYAAYVPGLQVNSSGTPGQVQISLRGISTLTPTAVVGSYIDDVPVGSSSALGRGASFALDLLPYDVDRVEVLRGPQGTLYGASTMGGLIKYVMRAPDLSEVELRAQTDLASIKNAANAAWGVRAGANVPLIDGTLGLRVSYFRQQTPGYIDDLRTGVMGEVQQQGGRLALLWKPDEAVSIKVAAMLQDIDAASRSQVTLDPATLQPAAGDLSSTNDLATPFKQRLRFYSATLNWNLGWSDFTSASSYARTDIAEIQDATPSFAALFPLVTQGVTGPGLVPFKFIEKLDKVTQEFRLTSPGGGRIEWLLGAFYTDEDSKGTQVLNALNTAGEGITSPTFNPFTGTPLLDTNGNAIPLNPLLTVTIPSGYREYAAFGNLTYRLTQHFDVTTGLRWARNSQDFSQTTVGSLTPLVGAPALTGGNSAENVVTYLVSPRFHLNDHEMVYLRFANGYRPGSPNVALAGVPSMVNADKTVNYELGLKSQLADSRLLLNVSVFRIDWNDIQLTVSAPGGISYGDNGGKARSQGAELETVLLPIRGLRLGLNAAYTDAVLTEDVPSIPGRNGDRLPDSPRWSGALTLDYQFPVLGAWSGRFGAGYRYVSDVYSQVQSSPQAFRSAPYGSLDLNAGLLNERWTFRVYAKNLTDKRAYLSPTALPDAFGAIARVDAAVLQPRTVGLAVDARF